MPDLLVLIVEDDADIAALEADIVTRSGGRATRVADGAVAIGLLGEREPPAVDLILLDLDLPTLSGQAVLDWLTTDPAWTRTPVIVVSGSLDLLRETPQVVAVLAKPFSLDLLVEAIGQARMARDAAGPGAATLFDQSDPRASPAEG